MNNTNVSEEMVATGISYNTLEKVVLENIYMCVYVRACQFKRVYPVKITIRVIRNIYVCGCVCQRTCVRVCDQYCFICVTDKE